jgi:putative membrane protein
MKWISSLRTKVLLGAALPLANLRAPEFEWWGGHMPWMWIFFPIGGFVVFFILIVLVLFLLLRRPSQRTGPETESALDILKKRYARGEISREEFEKMRQDILGK